MMSNMMSKNLKKAEVAVKDGFLFHVYETTDGEATVYYFPQESDVFTDNFGENPECPEDIARGEEIPSELILFSGRYSACKRWFNDDNGDAEEIAKASLKRLHDEDEWALSFYMNGCSYDGSATDIDAEYKEDGLTLY